MAFSVLTNPTAFVALQTLSGINNDLSTTQNRISTGLEVASVTDSGAAFSIAQSLRADVAGLNAVQDSLDFASSALSIGISAGETVSNLLIEAREITTAASDETLDTASRAALNNDFEAILAQIGSVVDSANFGDVNLIAGDGSADTLSAIIDLAGGVSGSTITVTGTSFAISGATLNITTSTFTTAAEAQTALNQVLDALSRVSTSLADFGAAFNQIELQSEFFTSLQDSLEVGIGNLVDADLAEESANLQSLQVQQQLGLTSLSIANSAPTAILSLF